MGSPYQFSQATLACAAALGGIDNKQSITFEKNGSGFSLKRIGYVDGGAFFYEVDRPQYDIRSLGFLIKDGYRSISVVNRFNNITQIDVDGELPLASHRDSQYVILGDGIKSLGREQQGTRLSVELHFNAIKDLFREISPDAFPFAAEPDFQNLLETAREKICTEPSVSELSKGQTPTKSMSETQQNLGPG